MLLVLKVMLLDAEVMLLAAEVMLLHAEVMLLHAEVISSKLTQRGLAHGEFNKDDLNNKVSQRERRPRKAWIDTKKGTLEGLPFVVCMWLTVTGRLPDGIPAAWSGSRHRHRCSGRVMTDTSPVL